MLFRLIKDLLGPRPDAAPDGEDYYALMGRIHDAMRPGTYVEIGIDDGSSLDLVAAGTRAIGIDPQPRLRDALPENVRVFAETSDAFFAQHDVEAELGGRKIDLAFIDGLHLFEFALRDFMNLERHCTPDSTILMHDCYPLDERTSARERTTAFWTGDVWRALVALREQRPDLAIATVAAPPSGLAIIRRLDPRSSLLHERYEQIVQTYMARPYAQIAGRKAKALNLVPAQWRVVASLLKDRLT